VLDSLSAALRARERVVSQLLIVSLNYHNAFPQTVGRVAPALVLCQGSEAERDRLTVRSSSRRLPGSNREIFGAKELRYTIQAVMNSLKKRPLNETRRKCSQSWLKARADVSSSHLNKHSLINSLAAYIDETCPRRVDAHAVLPPKISPVLLGSLSSRGLRAVFPEFIATHAGGAGLRHWPR
jgi:hypothetical protein